MLIAKSIEKTYRDLKVLKGIHLHIQKGEIVSIVGASGAGKSTLLHILGTLDTADLGSVEIAGKEITKMKGKEMARFRNTHIGFVFQNHNLLPEFTALENICIPAYLAGTKEEKAKDQAMELMHMLGIGERADHKPSQMSGGEQQRVAVARALINNPDIIFADEPSGNLDSKTAKELHELFFSLRERLQQTFVIVTHNKELADMADRKLTITDGVIL